MRRQGNPKRKPRLGERGFLMGFLQGFEVGDLNHVSRRDEKGSSSAANSRNARAQNRLK